MRWPETQGNGSLSGLEKVVSDLKEGSDIEGAVLVGGKDSIIACDLPYVKDPDETIPDILSMIDRWCASSIGNQQSSMFSHYVLDYNGNKIIAKRLENLTLLVMLQKQGYLGLAMLDIENSVRRINDIMRNSREGE